MESAPVTSWGPKGKALTSGWGWEDRLGDGLWDMGSPLPLDETKDPEKRGRGRRGGPLPALPLLPGLPTHHLRPSLQSVIEDSCFLTAQGLGSTPWSRRGLRAHQRSYGVTKTKANKLKGLPSSPGVRTTLPLPGGVGSILVGDHKSPMLMSEASPALFLSLSS